MNKIAFFVEGQTEAIFTQKLIFAIAGTKDLQVEIENASRYISFAKVTPPKNDTETYILIFDCQGDGAVKQRIKENQDSLRESGYSFIIGLRDLYPLKIEELDTLKENIPVGLSTDIPINIIISIMEVEAWFIQEYKHFTSLDNKLTTAVIKSNTGFDPETDDASTIRCPADFLNTAYELVGKRYKKKLYQVNLTTDHIDFNEIYFVTRTKRPDLDEYINELEKAL